MKKQQSRKALIVLTDGVDRGGSKQTLQQAIATAQRADTLVYSILFADLRKQVASSLKSPRSSRLAISTTQ